MVPWSLKSFRRCGIIDIVIVLLDNAHNLLVLLGLRLCKLRLFVFSKFSRSEALGYHDVEPVTSLSCEKKRKCDVGFD